MPGVLQSGQITAGHLAKWIASGVIGDAGPPLTGEQVLGYLSADFNNTNDQAIVINPVVNVFCITRIIVTNPSVSLTTAAGGFYPAAAKGGSAIVAAGQTYSALTTSNSLLNATLTAAGSGTRYSAANLTNNTIYLSLTTGQGVATTADVYVCGIDLTVRG